MLTGQSLDSPISGRRFAKWRQLLSGIQLALRASVAAGVAVALANALHLQHPIFALISAVIVTDLDSAQSRRLGFRRIVSTVIGAICGAVLSSAIHQASWEIAAGIMVAMIICYAAGAHEGAKVAGYTCAIVLLNNTSSPWEYAYFRFVETALGIAAAWSVSYIPKLVRIEKRDSLTR